MLTSKVILALGIWAGLTSLEVFAEAAPSDLPRAEIQSAYAKAALGARLKFVQGMLSHRAADFETFGADGRKLDLTLEREGFNRLFSTATRVDLATRVISLRARDQAVECRVEQRLSIQAPQPETRKTVTITLSSCTIDSWRHQGNLWKLRTRHILSHQSKAQEGGLVCP